MKLTPDIITKEIMEQYEEVRCSGACNMYDYYCVTRTARSMKLFSLASLSMEEYEILISNFNLLMKKHDIKQITNDH